MSTIKAVADKMNISLSTIRYYEKNGLLDICRKENNYREYSLDDEKKLKQILVMKYSGFSIKEIKELLSLNNEKILEDDCIRKINQLISMKMNEILMKIENHKSVLELLDMMKPLALAKTTTENELALEKQIDLILKKTLRRNKMKITIIIGHLYSKSFNYAILERVRMKTTATVINSVTENFNPAMLSMDLAGFSKGQFSDTLVDNIKILSDTEKFIIITPIWWYGLPSIYKGFLDKVMLKGFAYREEKGRLTGKMKNIKEKVIITTAEATRWYIRHFAGNPIKALKKRVFKDMGLKNVKWVHQGNITKTTQKIRIKFPDYVESIF